MTEAIQAIDSLIQEGRKSLLVNWRGYERRLLIEIIRSLDHAAFALTLAPNAAALATTDAARRFILQGAAMAMAPLLRAQEDQPAGFPWEPSHPRMIDFADRYLRMCGQLDCARRLIEAEKYGLTRVRGPDHGRIVIEVEDDAGEHVERRSGAWLVGEMREAPLAELSSRKKQSRKRIDRSVKLHQGWFIRYETSARAMRYHKKLAAARVLGNAESEALPPQAEVGGRSFSQWIDLANAAQGRALLHIANATRLLATHKHLDLRNLLTSYSDCDSAISLLNEQQVAAAVGAEELSILTLDHEGAVQCEREHEIPLPYFIRLAEGILLLPVFGALLNPCAALTWNLRSKYRTDWDRGVGGREARFREDLRQVFPPARYDIPEHGFKLRRENGEQLTDVDAIVLDRESGRLALVQLKWHDIFGHSLRERRNRLTNLLDANEWVHRVIAWTAGRSARDVAADLMIRSASETQSPQLIVLARHAARFTNGVNFDDRAAWISWPELVRIATENRGIRLLETIERDFAGGGVGMPVAKATAQIFSFPNLTVEIRAT